MSFRPAVVLVALAAALLIPTGAASAATPKQADRALGRALGQFVRMPAARRARWP